MKNTENIKYTLDIIEASISIVGEFVNFYIDFEIGNIALHTALKKIIMGYSFTLPNLPELLSGKPNGMNTKQELIKSLENFQVAFYFSDENPKKLKNTWELFSTKWDEYLKLIRPVIDSQRIMYIHLN